MTSVYEAHAINVLRALRDGLLEYRDELRRESQLPHYADGGGTSGQWALSRAVRWLDQELGGILAQASKIVGEYSLSTRPPPAATSRRADVFGLARAALTEVLLVAEARHLRHEVQNQRQVADLARGAYRALCAKVSDAEYERIFSRPRPKEE